ncbi:hypothetical protein LCGC14_2798510 [marine sediment metagenome]|uniref:Uncharacterized protein n=1 Tax=marine sediment metagenome TaxID=412755 RepID=A0A0F8YNJ5_9ZZZZ
MSNMGYCRFQNTLPDLRDCLEHLGDDNLSDEEIKARKRLAKVCRDLADEWEDFEEE